MGANPLRRPRHAFWAEIRAIGKHAGQHGGDVLRRISRPDMGELVGKSSPLMHFPQEIGHLNQWIHVRDFGIEGFRRCGNVAGMRRYDQRAVFNPHTIELAETGAPGQPFEIDVHHLPDFSQPGSAVGRDTEAELILPLQSDKGWLRHEIFVYRSE